MRESWAVLSASLPIFAIMALGWALRRRNWLTADADASLLRLTIHVLYPALILHATLDNPMLRRWDVVLIAPVVGFGTLLIGGWVAWRAAPLFGLRADWPRRAFAFTAGIQNYAYMAIPLTLLLFGREVVGVLLVHNLGVELAFWTVNLLWLTGRGKSRGWRQALNPPVLAVVAGVALTQLNLAPHIPVALGTALAMLGQSAIPVALLLIGATVADHLEQFEFGHGIPTMAGAVLVRLAVVPLLLLLGARFLPLPEALRQVLIIQAAMPAGVLPIVLCRHHGGDVRTALRVVLGTCAVALVSIPLVVRFGLWFVGLR